MMRQTIRTKVPSKAEIHAADTEIGARIRRKRRSLGLTQQDLALATGVSYQQIQKYERGTNRVSASRLFLISRALETSPHSFFENLGNKMRQSGEIRAGQQIDRTVIDDQVNEALTNLVNALKESAARSHD